MIDNYCERIDPAFWSEPVNALTNLAFVIAAAALARLLHARRIRDSRVWLLVLFVLAIGIGSFLFHTFATAWAALADVVPILLFQMTFLWTYLRRMVSVSRFLAATTVAALAVGIIATGPFAHLANGSLAYAPALVVLAALGGVHWQIAEQRWTLLLATGVFLVSVVLRSIDQAVCSSFPLGTHFAWHLLNGVVLFLAVYALTAPTVRSRPTDPAAAG
jgi:hypothetical protein